MDSYDLYDPCGDNLSERGDMDNDFLEMELVRSKTLHRLLPLLLNLNVFPFKSKEIWKRKSLVGWEYLVVLCFRSL